VTDADSALSADSADLADAVLDGVRLSELIESLPVSRGSVFELVKALGIETAKGPGPGGRGRVAWLRSADADRLESAAREVAAGRLRIADVGAIVQSRQAPQTPQTEQTLPLSLSPDSADGAGLLQRIEAAERALRTGFPLSTAEVAWIIGARPGGAVVVRGGLCAERLARNVWRLSAASPESAD
jgi:hypothetical protein